MKLWTVYLWLERYGQVEGAVVLGTIRARHQPAALLAAGRKWRSSPRDAFIVRAEDDPTPPPRLAPPATVNAWRARP